MVDRPDARRPRVRPHLREALVVVPVLVLLEAVVFGSHYTGARTPPWDFWSHYTTEAYAWWHDGSFFRPAQWLPYLWGGYPSVTNVQNSSWYLPVGLADALAQYDQHAAAVVSALHVAGGALGTYLLARAFGVRPPAAVLGLVVWFFAAGFYANASHLDIMRAYAWLPWVLLCASPRWPWARWWAPPVAVLVIWQAALGMYPGILIAGVYVGLVWVVVNQLTARPPARRYLLPLAAAVVLAGMLTLLRFLPAMLTRGAVPPGDGDTSTWSWDLLGTFLYPYDDPSLPGDITMRSFFVGAPVLAALVLVRRRAPLVRPAAAMGAAAVVMGLPSTPWHGAVATLPGMDVSRFVMSDLKPFGLLALCLLAVAAVDSLVGERSAAGATAAVGGQLRDGAVGTHAPSRTRAAAPGALRLVALAALLVGAAAVAVAGPFAPGDWLPQWVLLAVSAGLLLLGGTTLTRGRLRAVVAGLVAAAALSGLLGVFGTPDTWTTPRAPNELASFGAPVDTLTRSRTDEIRTDRRPARAGTVEDLSTRQYLVGPGGRAFYGGTPGLAGYTNLKGTPTFETIFASLQDPARGEDAWAFWLAPGLAVASPGGFLPDAATTRACAADGACGVDLSRPVRYVTEPEPRYVYELADDGPVDVAFNEAYYPGWRVTACPADGSEACERIPVRSGAGGQLVAAVPAGHWTVQLDYRLPGATASWALFGASVAVTLAWAAWLGSRARRRGAAAAARVAT